MRKTGEVLHPDLYLCPYPLLYLALYLSVALWSRLALYARGLPVLAYSRVGMKYGCQLQKYSLVAYAG